MFNLENIKFIKSDDQRGRRHYSFVGIQRNEGLDKEQYPLEFWLPLGFNDFDDKDFNEVKKFFFKMYRTFKTYLQKKQDSLEENDITINRDGIIEKDGGFSFINENKEQTVFYGKLNSLEKIIEGYDELRISSLEKKQVRSHEIDYSKLHRYLHQAIYLDEDVIYLDEMNIAKNVIIKSSPPILQLFCFIYVEIKTELEEFDDIPTKAIELAEQFKEEHLQPNSQLFGENTFEETVNTLKEKLDTIDIETTYKDEDFWHFFETVEAFLYGERQEDNEGIYWGFSSFYDIWEDMCQTYALNSIDYEPRAIFADVNGILLNRFNVTPSPFEVKMNNLPPPFRYLRPDLVLVPILELQVSQVYWKGEYSIKKQNRNSYRVGLDKDNFNEIRNKYPNIINKFQELIQKEENTATGKIFSYMFQDDLIIFENFIAEQVKYKIIDYKYMRLSNYQDYSPFFIDEKGENKVKEDIHKQLVYEWTVQKNWSATTQSEFWIPFFSKDTTIFEKEEPINNVYFNQSQIKVFKINFKTLQEFYIKQALL